MLKIKLITLLLLVILNKEVMLPVLKIGIMVIHIMKEVLQYLQNMLYMYHIQVMFHHHGILHLIDGNPMMLQHIL